MTPCVVFQVSQPYSSTDLTFELKSLIFVEIEILNRCFPHHSGPKIYVIEQRCRSSEVFKMAT